MVSRLMQTIMEALGVPLRFPEGYKPNLKSDGISKYTGSLTFSDLEEWLSAVSHRYALMKFRGDMNKIDCLRVISLLDYLGGDALKWYTTHVLGPRR